MMADDDESEDPVVHEVDVYLSKSLATNLYLLQYPLRPGYMTYEEVEHTGARIKPNQSLVELELALNTKSPNYSRSRGEQYALNVEGRVNPNGDEPYFTSGIMDKQVLKATPCPVDINRYAVGVLKNDELHLTPLHALVQMRPSFDYLDKADSKQKADTAAKEAAAAAASGESSQDEEDEAQAVTVTFARPESQEAKARRMASYEYVQRRKEEEPWTRVAFNNLDAEGCVESELMHMYVAHGGEKHQQFHCNARQYLDMLVPPPDNSEQVKPPKSNNILSRQQLKLMPLNDSVRALLTNVKVLQFSKLMELLPEGTDPLSALRVLQQAAVMVQGCWVVKSEVLYPKDTCSPHSGVSAEHLIRGRDFVMWKFTHCKFVSRKEVSSGLPSEDVKDILEQMSRLRSSKGWEFVFDYDRDFVERHPDVVQRQRLLWEAKYQSLCKHVKLPKDADKKAREAEQILMMQANDRPRRRRASSKSSPRKRTLSGRSMSDLSDIDMETDAAGDRTNGDILNNLADKKLTIEPMEVCGEEALSVVMQRNGLGSNTSNSADMKPKWGGGAGTGVSEGGRNSALLRTELVTFARDVMLKHSVLKFEEVRREFYLKLSQQPPGHVLSSGVSDRMLDEAMLAAGGCVLNKPLTNQSHAESVYACLHQGNRLDKVREVLYSMLEHTWRLKSTPYISKVKEMHGDEFSEADMRKVLKDICDSRNNNWYIRGVSFNS